MRNHVTCCTPTAQCSRLTDRFERNNCYSIERSSRSTHKSSNFGSSYHSSLPLPMMIHRLKALMKMNTKICYLMNVNIIALIT